MPEPRRHIVAMGGGGFSMEEEPFLDDFVLSLARAPRPRVCFLPTASGDSGTYIVKFYRAFGRRDCRPSDLTLFESGALPRQPKASPAIEAFILEQDVIYVGGGNTANMVALWRVHGVDRALRRAHAQGVVLAGVSAGMICWFETGVTDSFGGVDPFRDGLGILEGSACPHYDGEVGRRAAFHAAIRDGLPAGFAADDGAALHFVDDELSEVVASRPSASGYRVERRDGEIVEERLAARFLGAAAAVRS